ncbi:glucose-6-phosphate isomerase [Ascidiimonas aurantiaca]|uniref:glucose-6-phosphate isomerase n=1 Tax=Ascidiimonas aurantiaca TaxID=1685432 RepID=UPI0030EBEE82
MALRNVNPTDTQVWQELCAHFEEIKNLSIKETFAKDPERAHRLTTGWNDFLVDYSKNRVTDKTLELLIKLAESSGLQDAIEKYFSGDVINQTEKRAVLHTALRADENADIRVDGKNVVPEIKAVKRHIKRFSEEVISGTRTGFTNKTFTHVVNIGIGGSDLGPAMVTEALQFYKNHLQLKFISNVDGDHVLETLKTLDPETTLFVIVSKTFTTQETLSNATTIKNWFLQYAEAKDIERHFVAVSTNLTKIREFGIADENVFPMWDWVGGRFSLWSAVGLSISLGIGYQNFEALLKGACEMDTHFRKAPLRQNIPVILGMLTVWYNNFFEAETEAIIPYTQYLNRFSAYLQQGIMESNGKSVDRNGAKTNYQTGTVIWGEPGTNSQHAFFQLIHQGTKLIPADFIGFVEPLHGEKEHHTKLMANFFAQTEALLHGKSSGEVRKELEAINLPENEIAELLPFKVFDGNKPTTTILINKLTPFSLGALIALYEHKIFVQGVIWNIYSYDQWGVELGKQLASKILKEMKTGDFTDHDASTINLLKHFNKNRI